MISSTRSLRFDSDPIPFEQKKSHCLDTHGKRSNPHPESPARLEHSKSSPELSAGENVRYLQEDGSHSVVSGEHPYQRRNAHKGGRDLRYGGIERYKKAEKSGEGI